MAFGFGSNTLPTSTTGFRTSSGFGGFNVGNGLRSSVGNFLKKEFSYAEVFGKMVQFQQQLSTFDWNQTDEELRARYKQMELQMASAMGGLVGRSIGSAVAIGLGGAAGLVVPKISSGQLAKRLVEAASEEARDEIVGEVSAVMTQVKNMAFSALAIETYINFRNALKKAPDSLLLAIYPPATVDFIKNTWGNKEAQPLVLQEALEEKIESITNPRIRAFVEEMVEEFFESIIETGYIIASELDSALREFQLDRVQNTERIITLQTIADEPNSERFVIDADNYEEAEDEIRNTIQQWRIMQNRSVGQIITRDVEILESHPQLRRLEIIFKSRPYPPFINSDGTQSQIAVLTIPNFKDAITWSALRRDLKYSKTEPCYYWGDHGAALRFTDKRKIQIKYDRTRMTKESISAVLKSFAELSKGEIKTISASEIIEQPRQLRDDGIGMYPVSCKIINRNLTNLNQSEANRLPTTSYEFDLWTDNEPANFYERFNTIPPPIID